MTDSPFMEQLHNFLRQEEQIFKFKRAVQTKSDALRIDILVNSRDYDARLTKDLKQKVDNAVAQILPAGVKFKVNYIKTVTEPKYVIKAAMDYIYSYAPTIFSSMEQGQYDVEIISDTVILNMTLEKYLCDYISESGLSEKIAGHLGQTFMEEGRVNIIEVPNVPVTEVVPRPKMHENSTAMRIVDINIIESYRGTVGQAPRYIADVLGAESQNLTVCGVVSNVRERTYERDGKTKSIFTFSLNDTTGVMPAKFFAPTTKVVWPEVIKDGETLVIKGEYRHDNFDNRLVMVAQNVAKCSISYNSIDIRGDFFTESEEYICIRPEKFLDTVQGNLFFEETGTNPDLLNKTFVVFDLETTGTDITKDRAVEIGAVKIEGGRITESFQTLIDPEMPIPKGASDVNGIVDEMVKNQPKFKDIVGDFYKFTRKSTLVAHNAPFDMGILTRQAVKERYDFDNPHADTLIMARQSLNLGRFNLAYVSKALNVPLEGAHRSLNDAVATARVFIKLMNMRAK